MSKNKVLVIGESCRDIFVYCDANRLAPDVPVPVLSVVNEVENFGMAKNVHRNIANIIPNCDIVTNYNWHEITKTRYVHNTTNHTFFRVDSPSPMPVFDFTSIKYDQYDVIVIADYAKGFLHEKDVEYICSKHNFVFLDTKKILGDWAKNAFIIKINDYEYTKSFNNIIKDPDLRDKVVHTMGGAGAEYQNIRYRVQRVEVKDSSGAGDSFMAAMVIKWLETKKMDEAIKYANEKASETVKHRGVTSI